MNESKEKVRKLIAAAFCDFVAYLGKREDPFIVGGQYENKKLIEIFREFLKTRNFSANDIGDEAKNWLLFCEQNMFGGDNEN